MRSPYVIPLETSKNKNFDYKFMFTNVNQNGATQVSYGFSEPKDLYL